MILLYFIISILKIEIKYVCDIERRLFAVTLDVSIVSLTEDLVTGISIMIEIPRCHIQAPCGT